MTRLYCQFRRTRPASATQACQPTRQKIPATVAIPVLVSNFLLLRAWGLVLSGRQFFPAAQCSSGHDSCRASCYRPASAVRTNPDFIPHLPLLYLHAELAVGLFNVAQLLSEVLEVVVSLSWLSGPRYFGVWEPVYALDSTHRRGVTRLVPSRADESPRKYGLAALAAHHLDSADNEETSHTPHTSLFMFAGRRDNRGRVFGEQFQRVDLERRKTSSCTDGDPRTKTFGFGVPGTLCDLTMSAAQ